MNKLTVEMVQSLADKINAGEMTFYEAAASVKVSPANLRIFWRVHAGGMEGTKVIALHKPGL
jgi:hypothetical protein